MSTRGKKKESQEFLKEMRRRIVKAKGCGPDRPGPINCVTSVAKACGTSSASISLYLSGKREPTLWLAMRIARYLGISLDTLPTTLAESPAPHLRKISSIIWKCRY